MTVSLQPKHFLDVRSASCRCARELDELENGGIRLPHAVSETELSSHRPTAQGNVG